MAEVVDSLRVKLSPEGVQEIIAALRSVATESQRAGQRAESAFAGFGKAAERLRGILGAVGVALSVGALANFTKRSAEFADSIDNATQRLGGATDATVGLALAMRIADTDIESASKAMNVFSKNVDDFAKGGGKAADAFHRLGLEAADFKGKNVTEALVLVSHALAQVKDGFEKNALAADAFGRTALNLIPLFNLLGREGAEKFIKTAGRLFSPELNARAAELSDTLARAGLELQLIGVSFAGGVAQPVIEAIGRIEEAVAGLGTDAVSEFGRAFGSAIASVLDLLTALLLRIADLGKALGGLRTLVGFVDLLAGAFGQLALGIEDVLDRVATRTLQVGRLIVTIPVFIQVAFTQGLQAAKDQVEKIIKDIEKDTADLRARVKAREEQSRVLALPPDQRRREAAQGGLVGPPVPPGLGAYVPPAEFDAKAVARARAEAELEVTRARIKAEEDANESAYRRGLKSLEDFYARRLALARSSSAAELNALRQQLANVTESDPGKAEAQREKIRGQIAAKEVEFQARERQLAVEAGEARIKLESDVLRAQESVNVSRVEQHERRLREIEEETRAFRILVEQQRRPVPIDFIGPITQQQQAQLVAIERDVDAFAERLRAKEQAAFAAQRVEDELSSLAGAREQIDDQVQAGLLSQTRAQAELLQLEKERLAVLLKLRDAAREAAEADAGDEEAQARYAEVSRGVEQVSLQLEAQEDVLGRVSATFEDAFASNAVEALSTVGKSADQLADTWRNAAISIVASIQQMIVKMLVLKAFQFFTGLSTGGSAPVQQSARGNVDYARGGLVWQRADVHGGMAFARGGVAHAHGGTAYAHGGFVRGISVAGAPGAPGGRASGTAGAAAGSPVVRVAVGAVDAVDGSGRASPVGDASPVGLARGGVLAGPGGPMSDAIPDRVPAGTFILRASAVARAGRGLIERLARGGPSRPGERLVDVRLSAGEAKFPPEVVQRPGMLQFLTTLNEGGAVPELREPWGPPRLFAEGGLVAASGTPPQSNESAGTRAEVVLRLAKGLVAEEIRQPSGRKALIEVVQEERRGYRQSLGLGD